MDLQATDFVCKHLECRIHLLHRGLVVVVGTFARTGADIWCIEFEVSNVHVANIEARSCSALAGTCCVRVVREVVIKAVSLSGSLDATLLKLGIVPGCITAAITTRTWRMVLLDRPSWGRLSVYCQVLAIFWIIRKLGEIFGVYTLIAPPLAILARRARLREENTWRLGTL